MHNVPIQYREFYDVPRMFVADHEGQTFLFDGSFDDELDDYPAAYAVFAMPRLSPTELGGSWNGLRGKALWACGSVPTSAVTFDATRRATVSSDVFARLQHAHRPVGRAV